MSKKKIPWDVLLEIIGRFPEGARLEEVELGLNPQISRRTLQRWVSSLVQSNVLIAIGNARARRYKLSHSSQKQVTHPREEILFPISKSATKILKNVTRPLQARNPITYNREFLENYRPNVTYYLSEIDRKQLLEMGRTEEGTYPAGTYARQIFHRLLIDLSWNSSRLEGNTYSLLETKQLLEYGNAAEGKDLKETQMILNHKAAIEFIIHSAGEIGINRYTILSLHTLLSDNLLPDPEASGRLRRFSVGISHSTYLPIAIPQVIQECFDLLIAKAILITNPFEQAFFLMVQIPYLQAFDDVNKRTSRLAANIPLVRNNLIPLSFIDVPESTYINGLLGIYELNQVELLRDVFLWAYKRSCIRYSTTRQSIGQPDPFRMRYRLLIQETIREIVLGCMNTTQAVNVLRQKTLRSIPKQDQPFFLEAVEKEILSLHEGNIARYQLRPEEFENWKKSQ